jgi:hypothetical protein
MYRILRKIRNGIIIVVYENLITFKEENPRELWSVLTKQMATMLILPSKPLILSICHFWKIEDVHQGLQLGKTFHPRRTLPWRPTGLL